MIMTRRIAEQPMFYPLTDDEKAVVLEAWQRGKLDTAEIAGCLQRHESLIYNFLAHAKAETRDA